MVAVAEKPPVRDSESPPRRTPTRSAEQERLLRDHHALVREMYSARDPQLVQVLEDTTVLWVEDLIELFGLTDLRIYALYSEGTELAQAGYTVHPGGIPVPDTSGGKRGKFPIRGITRGRLALWALGSGRGVWNPETGEFTFLKANAVESMVARAQAALNSGTVPEHYRPYLRMRVEHPDKTTAEIAALMHVTKAQFTSKLRRALMAAEKG